MEYHKFPIGIEDFKELRESGSYYVDKSALAREIAARNNKVFLFTRPRRFGKTLALSMLGRFFDCIKPHPELFEGLEISRDTVFCREHQGKYPVIMFSCKDITDNNYENAYRRFRHLLGNLADQFQSLLSTSPENGMRDRRQFQRLIDGDSDDVEVTSALELLSRMLHIHTGQPVIILLDEYDVMLRNAYLHNYYDRMLPVIRTFMSSTFKGNPHMKWGVVTGCLRAARESIYTGFNNPYINTVLSTDCPEYFGFTSPETESLLRECGLAERIPDVQEWYDGYLFGETQVYNPWDVINYAQAAMRNPKGALKPYWAGTSSNDILTHLLEMSDRGKVRQEIEGLLEGHPVVKSVSEMTSFKALKSNPDSIWNTMLFTGYLKPREPVLERETAELVLPNHELKVILANCIDEWMDKRYAHMNWQPLAKAFMEGDADAAEQSLNALLMTCISYYDYRESYYHGFLTGLLNGDGMSYTAWSNRESGSGRSDIMAMRNDGLCGCVIEIKIAKNIAELPTACEAAIRQLNTLDYATELLGRGCRKLFSYGVAFWKKRCLVKSEMVTE